MDRFRGFDVPQQNWSKLPHALIEALPLIETSGELKVLLYILRHTWGYQEFSAMKKITLDEFCNGRKRRDGARIDAGTGLSRPTVIDGLKRAEEHGFITSTTDNSDGARVKKAYALSIAQDEEDVTTEVKRLYQGGKETLPRSEKDTIERNQEKTSPASQAAAPRSDKPKPEAPHTDTLPHNLDGWIDFVAHGNGRGGPQARVVKMVETLWPRWTPEKGSYGLAAKTASRVGGYARLAQLLWQANIYRVTGNPLVYVSGIAKKEKEKQGAPGSRNSVPIEVVR
jgi:DNA-binding PadR family transcriptional regulator